MKILIKSAILFTLLISYICLAAEYVPPSTSNAGTLRFDNIVVDPNGMTSAILVAADDAGLQVGQVYILNVNDLKRPVGSQDAAFDSVTRKFTSKNIIESSGLVHNLTMFLTKIDNSSPGFFEFIVTDLQTRSVDTEDTLAGIDVESVYIESARTRSSVTCRDAGDLMLTGGAICESGSTLTESRPFFRKTDDGVIFAWLAECLQPPPAKPVSPKTIYVMCILSPR